MKSKVVKLLAISAAAVLVTGCLAGCGKSSATVVTASINDEEISEMVSDMDLDEMMSDFSDEVEGSDLSDAISVSIDGTCTTDHYSFKYDPTEFSVIPEDDDSITVSYENDSVQTAGDNIMTITEKSGTDYETILKEEMAKYGISDAEITESNFGADGIKAYSCTTGKVQKEGSDVSTMETVYAIPSGDNVILINVSRTLGADEEAEMDIDDGFAAILDTFTVTDAQ